MEEHALNYEKTKELVKSGHQLVVLLGTQNGMHEAASLVQRMAGQLDVLIAVLREKTKQCEQLAAECAYLMNGAAAELNTSWMLHKTMLGAQAALVCIVQGDIKSARDWLEGTTDEAGAELPHDITVAGLQPWFDSQMVSNDGKTGFLTREEAEKAIRAEIPATEAFLREVKSQARQEGAYFVANRMLAAWDAGFIEDTAKNAADIARMILTSTEFMADAPDGDFDRAFADSVLADIAAQLRVGGGA
ncbi:hypothetical protein BTK77_012505 [Cronobacter sakazakii]|nr:hypothetical protein BTK63_19475 [Cronobacter sakazakii]PUY41210.1 hypothetical protein BTK66_20340 [Cronobacter sakazakii]PUY43482.1 hypothetical protein BTK68_16900 [Cronobacter sakazakii]PUY48845.1 hypothetical protein BTK65_18730 [Cronobacter sakazakii]QXL92321.1 hypothetical protein BTK77_012505 [Cronobacter sakazakii]